MISLEAVSFVNTLLSLGAVVLQLCILFVLYCLFSKKENALFNTIKKNSLLLSFLIALTGMIASLVYSEIVGYEPCSLCWYQRIFLYPQVLLLGMALRKYDALLLRSSFILSVIGGMIAAYHTVLQFTGSLLPCPAGGVSCAQRFFIEFGYMTIPTLSLTVFAALIVLFYVQKKENLA